MSDLRKIFQKYIAKKIILYGLGTETEKALKELGDEFQIVGLLDSFQESGELYGKRILSLRQASELHIEVIIVVARPGSCKVIAKHVKDICIQYNIELLDIRGKNLLVSNEVIYDFCHVKGAGKKELIQKASQADTISFDLFDTLATRKVLSYTDIFELMEKKLWERGCQILDFPQKRLGAEKKLTKSGAPTLEQIYELLIEELDIQNKFSALELAELEWEIDYSTIVPREAVCEIFNSMFQSGREIYIVTDTYYRRSRLEKILQKCGVQGYTDVVASCEHKVGKCQGLFSRFKKLYGKGRCLHIGDDVTADIEAAKNCGIETFRLYSGNDLLDELGALELEDYTNCLADRIKVGLFTAELLNDPFWFEDQKRELKIMDAHKVGYILFAPMILDFILWFYNRIKRQKISNIWFSARDGYLLRKLYRMIDDIDTEYFLTSRIAAIRAGMEDVSDVEYVDSMKFSGTIDESMQVRFGIDSGKLEKADGNENGLLQYTDLILEKAKQQRIYYKKYIDTLRIKSGEIAFFDFVAKGTAQMYVQKVINGERTCCLRGFYFLQLEPEFMEDKKLEIESFYKADEQNGSAIFDNYYVLETILTAPHPMIVGFDVEGNAVFAEETRRRQDIDCSVKVQSGIEEYFKDFLELLPKKYHEKNKELDEIILGLIRKIKIMDDDFLSMIVEDPFFNRMTKLCDIVS